MFELFNINVKKNAFLLFFLLLCLITIIIFWDFLTFKRLYVLCDDAYSSFWPSLADLSQALKSDLFPMWSFSDGLGQQITTGNPNWLWDPFSWPSFLFSREAIPLTFGYVAALKIILSGLFFYLFLCEFGVSYFSRIVFSLSFAFNGHMILRGIWMHYATEVVFVALWLWSMERFYNKKSLFFFSFSLAMLFVSRHVSYLYLYTILTFAYFIFREWFQGGFNLKIIFHRCIVVLPWYFLGLSFSAVSVVPGILQFLNSDRIQSSFSLIRFFSITDLSHLEAIFLKIFSYDLLGVLSTIGPSKVILEDPVLYCGIFSVIVIPHVFFLKTRQHHKRNAVFGILFMVATYYLLPYFRYTLNGFSSLYYKTSSFWTISCFLFAAIFITEQLLKHKICYKNKKKHRIIIFITFVSYIIVILLFMSNNLDEQITKSLYRMSLFVSLLSIFLFYGFYDKKYYSVFKPAVILLLAFEIATGTNSIFYNKTQDQFANVLRSRDVDAENINEIVHDFIDAPEQTDKFLRVMNETPYWFEYNYSKRFGYFGLQWYSSVSSKYAVDFVRFWDLRENRPVILNTKKIPKKLYDLMNYRYYLTKETERPDGWVFLYKKNGFHVYKNNDFISFGFSFSNYITEVDFKQLDDERKKSLILEAIILSEENSKLAIKQGLVPYYCKTVDNGKVASDNSFISNVVLSSMSGLQNISSKNEEKKVLIIKEFYNNKITGLINFDRPSFLLFPFPYDKGWTARINGKVRELLPAHGGLCGIFLKEGDTTVTLRYITPGLIAGATISFISLSLCFLLFCWKRNK